LYSIDAAANTMVIRVETGMIQTFRWDDATEMKGSLPDNEIRSHDTVPGTRALMKQLARHCGSELAVEWKDLDDEKIATSIDVKDLAPLSRPRKPRSSRR
jgi:hypothetical protein